MATLKASGIRTSIFDKSNYDFYQTFVILPDDIELTKGIRGGLGGLTLPSEVFACHFKNSGPELS